jgi:hypothetical protein
MSLNKKSINELFRKLVEIEKFVQENKSDKQKSQERIDTHVKSYIQDIIKLYLKIEDIINGLDKLRKIKKSTTVNTSLSVVEYKSHNISDPNKINAKILIEMNDNIKDYLTDLYKKENLLNSHKNIYTIIHDFKILLKYIELKKVELVDIGNLLTDSQKTGNANATLQTIAFVKLVENNSIKSLKKIIPESVLHTISVKYRGGKTNNKTKKNKN